MNEHLDMSGNPSDAPFECHQCKKIIDESKAYGSDVDGTLLFCSESCVEEWEFTDVELAGGEEW